MKRFLLVGMLLFSMSAAFAGTDDKPTYWRAFAADGNSLKLDPPYDNFHYGFYKTTWSAGSVGLYIQDGNGTIYARGPNPPVAAGWSHNTSWSYWQEYLQANYHTDADFKDWIDGTGAYSADGAWPYKTASPADYDGDGVSDVQEMLDGTDFRDSEDYVVPEDYTTDSDGDGYTDYIENASGTDPNDALSFPVDADGDGVPDWIEIECATNPDDPLSLPFFDETDGEFLDVGSPSAFDTDGDGVYDWLERYQGTDPNDPESKPLDSDGDGWPDQAEIEAGTDPFNAASLPGYWDIELGFIPSDGWTPPVPDWDSPSDDWTPPVPDPVLPDLPNPANPFDDGYTTETETETVTPETDSEIPTNTGTVLTQEDMAKAVRAALVASKGTLSDAVRSGVFLGTQHLDQEVAEGIHNARHDIYDAVRKGVEDANKATGNASVTVGLGEGPQERGDVEFGAETGEGLEGVTSGLGVGSLITDFTPTGQTNHSVSISLPNSFAAGGSSAVLGSAGDFTFAIDSKPDTSTALGVALNTFRLIVRLFCCVLITWRFQRAVMGRLYQIT